MGDDWYKSKDGGAKFYDHRLSKEERKREGMGRRLGESFSGKTESGAGIRGNKDGSMDVNAGELKGLTVSGGLGKEGAEAKRVQRRGTEAYRRAYELRYMPYMGPDAVLLNLGGGYYRGFGGKVNFSAGYVDGDWGIFVTPAAGAGFEGGGSATLTFGNKIDPRASGYSGIAGWGSSIDGGVGYVTGGYGRSYNDKGAETWDFYTIGAQTPGGGVSISKSYTLPLIHAGKSGFGTVTAADIARMWSEIRKSQ